MSSTKSHLLNICDGELVNEEVVEKGKIIEFEAVKDRKSSTDSSASLSKSEFSNPTENELINLDDVELSDDEDTWLYTSPKDLTKEEKGLSPYKWLRQDIEDPSNHQLQMAKTALVSKLDELHILGSYQNVKLSTKTQPVCFENAENDCASLTDFTSGQPAQDGICIVTEELGTVTAPLAMSEVIPEVTLDVDKLERKQLKAVSVGLKDVSDVLERARLQEESLKLSSSKFFYETARTFPRGSHLKPSTCFRSANLVKPASIEAIYANNEKQNSTVSSSINIAQKKLHSIPNQSPFGSTTSLNFTSDVHRSSLPNLNRDYHSLKSKKSKRMSEPRIQCPLPVYPKAEMNNIIIPEVRYKCMLKTATPTSARREFQTLPSSYKSKSKKSSVNKLEPPFSSLRRDSSPSLLCQKNNFVAPPSQQETLPFVAQQNRRKNSGMFAFQGGSMPVLQSDKTVNVNQFSPDSSNRHDRNESLMPSPNKRQPLSSVHNYGTKHDYVSIQSNRELRKSSLPSKIPSPSVRSGIPVPSQYSVDDRLSSPTDNSWSQDFY